MSNYVCEECREPCGISLENLRIELPDWPHTAYEFAWVSTCCAGGYHTPQKEPDETD